MSSKFKYDSYGNSIEGTNYCTGIETYAQNLVEDNENDASIIFPADNGWATLRCSGYKLETGNCEAILPSPIYKLVHFYIKPEKTLFTGNGGRIDNYFDSNGKTFQEDFIDYIVPVVKWKSLLIAKGDYKGGVYKDNTFFWEDNNNIIQFISTTYRKDGIDQPIFGDNTPVYQRLLATMLKKVGAKYVDATGDNLSEQTISSTDPRDWKFRVEYIPMSSATKIRARKRAAPKEDYIQPINQRAEINSASALGKFLYNTAQKTGTEQITLVRWYKHISDTQFASDLAEFTIQNGATLEDGNPVTDATVGNLWIEVKEYVKSAESSAVQATNSAARAEEFAEEAEQSAKEATDEIKNTIKPKIEKLEQTDTEIKESLNKKADLEGDNNYTGTQSYGTQDRLKVIVSGTGITFEYGVYKYEITHTGFTEKNYDTGEIYQTINWEDLCSLAQNTARLNRSNTFQDENTFEEAIQAKKGTVVKNSLDETNYNAGYISRNGWTYLFPADSGTFALKKDIPSPATTEEIEALF